MKTDSFHGLCFSIIYQKEYIEYKDNYRINNLINILNIKFKNSTVINYSEIYNNIEYERKRTLDYFNNICMFKYACYSKDKVTHDLSTSGGICAELARYTFNNNGIVYGASYNKDFSRVNIIKVDNIEDYFKYISKSKYNFSFLPKLEIIKKELDDGQNILYIGSPCQIVSIKKYLKKDYNNLILIDFKCYGFSSNKKLLDFVNNIKNKYKQNIKKIDFRPEHKVRIDVTLEDDTIINFDKKIAKHFYMDTIDKCKKCLFDHGKKLSQSDITVGDIWCNSHDVMKLGTDFTPENGCNIVRTNTLKGLLFFDKIKNKLNIKQLSKDCY